MLDLDQLLAYAVERGASDVHLKVGSPPFIRIDGRLERIEHASVSQVETERIAFAIMPKQRAEEFIATSDADFAYSVSGVGRFRVNAMRQRGSVGLVLRRVQSDIPSFEALGLPPVVRKLAEHERGLVLVTGPTGSGKTTTLGSMIDYINETQHKHIVTIEDPIEILHPDKASIVNQREVGTDTSDFHAALKRVLRQDPDVILVGEMRDIETVKTALTAAVRISAKTPGGPCLPMHPRSVPPREPWHCWSRCLMKQPPGGSAFAFGTERAGPTLVRAPRRWF